MLRILLVVSLLATPCVFAQDPAQGYNPPSSNPHQLVNFQDKVYFVADDGVHGNELWRFNPDTSKPEPVVELTPGAAGSLIDYVRATADTLWFRLTRQGEAPELWASDGIPGGNTQRVWRRQDSGFERGVGALLDDVKAGFLFTSGADGEFQEMMICAREDRSVSKLCPVDSPMISSAGYFAKQGDEMYFGARGTPKIGIGLWRTDGTPEGTRFVHPFWNYPTPALSLGEAGVLVVAETEACGIELWITQGTPETTRLVRDILPGSESSRPADLRLDLSGAGPAAYFAATAPESGRELWRTDGTEAGTVLVQDIVPGRDSSEPYRIETAPNGMYLIASTPETGKELFGAGVVNGRYGPVTLMQEGLVGPENSEPYAMCMNDDGFLFYAQRSPDGEELWCAHKNLNFVEQLSDINPRGDSEPFWPVLVQKHVYFTAYDPLHGRELWRDRGVRQPPALVADINSDESINPSSSPSEMTALGDRLLFAADDIEHGYELWATDGTEEGTVLLRDIALGLPSGNPEQITPVGSLAYFRAESLGIGVELWVTDGTPEGTILVKDIYPEEGSSFPDHLIAFGDMLLFMAQTPREGNELWRLRAGREPDMLANIRGGPDSTEARNFFVWKDHVYFLADDGVHGEELWRTDGKSGEGTVMVKDIIGAPFEPLSISRAYPVGPRLYLSGRSPSLGHELWVWQDGAGEFRPVRDIATPDLLDVRAKK